MTSRFSRALALLAAAILALAALLVPTMARADPPSSATPPTAPTAGSVTIAQPGEPATIGEVESGFRAKDTTGKTHYPQLVSISVGHSRVFGYCIESSVLMDASRPAVVAEWDSYLGKNAFASSANVRSRVLWIILHSYPTVDTGNVASAASISGLTAREAITATQMAVWHLVDGLELASITSASPTESARIKALYRYLLDGSAHAAPDIPAAVGIDIAGGEGAPVPGLAGPFLLSVDDDAALTVEGAQVVDASGVPVELSPDTEFYVAPEETAEHGTLTVTAIVPDSRAAGALVVTPLDGDRHAQTFMVAGQERISRTGSTTVEWTLTPEPTPSETPEETPVDTPSTISTSTECVSGPESANESKGAGGSEGPEGERCVTASPEPTSPVTVATTPPVASPSPSAPAGLAHSGFSGTMLAIVAVVLGGAGFLLYRRSRV
ncbi:thioester domain-containing protein [Neoactinobaculum massilliense]|uniref:thioester domain-containing protein n=1 Tax=Neoactinobaculum massilliense TaxID=2364794 RepID=UPI000F52EA53|nr:thioester domain-containing protein [Neoactinobaculum massilliense]